MRLMAEYSQFRARAGRYVLENWTASPIPAPASWNPMPCHGSRGLTKAMLEDLASIHR